MKHAKLSASSSSRWLNCPGSVKASELYEGRPEVSSDYADEGTVAHKLADMAMSNRNDVDKYDGIIIDDRPIDSDMVKYVQEYLDYVYSYETATSILFCEERVDYSNYVPEGFGTLDAAIYIPETRTCHIFDLKYGKGIRVEALNNTQMMLYALGIVNEMSFLFDIETIHMHIAQPRLFNYATASSTIQELTKFGRYCSARAELALGNNPKRIPGETQCRWCAHKANCVELKEFSEAVITQQFDDISPVADISLLTDEQKCSILDNRKLIESFMKAVNDDVFSTLSMGTEFKGYKLVRGRSNRRWDTTAEKVLVDKLAETAYEVKLIGVGVAQQLLSKQEVDDLTYKPEGKLALAPESDKRQAVTVNVVNEFEALDK